MIDILSSTLVTPGYNWKAPTTPAPRSGFTLITPKIIGVKRSIDQVDAPATSCKVARPLTEVTEVIQPPKERNGRGNHKKRHHSERPIVQAYRVWSKRKHIHRRRAVKIQVQDAELMEEVIPAPLEEVFLMEEILPAPLEEVKPPLPAPTMKPAFTSVFDSGARMVACNGQGVACGRFDCRTCKAPSSRLPNQSGFVFQQYQPPPQRSSTMSAFCRGLGAPVQAWNPVPRATLWQYAGQPFQFLNPGAIQPTFHRQYVAFQQPAPVPTFDAPSSSSLTDIGDLPFPGVALPSVSQSSSSLAGPELGSDGAFLVGGAEHKGVRGCPLSGCARVPDAFVGEGEDEDDEDEVEFIL